jgi:ABC-type uncharacterized transport system permease subunit
MTPLVGDFLFVLAAATYLVATALFGVYLFRDNADVQGTRSRKLAPHALAFGAGVHAAQIVVASELLHVCPVQGVHFAMSVLSVLMVLAYGALRRRWRMDIVGAFIAPLALASLLASHFVQLGSGGAGNETNEPSPALRSALVPFHVMMNLGGVALFALAFGAASLYLVQEHLLKEKQIEGVFRRLPPLDSLDRAEHRFLLAGFPLLTIGLLTGTFFVRHLDTTHLADLARLAFEYIPWMLAAGVLLLRAAAGWRGRRAAYGTIAGFVFAVLVLVSYGTRSAPAAVTVGDQVAMANASVTSVTNGTTATSELVR